MVTFPLTGKNNRNERKVQQKNAAFPLHISRMAVGTDAGSPGVHHGEAVREEIESLVVAGLGLDEAVQCAFSISSSPFASLPSMMELS
jgi:hypothetical protein